MTFKTVKIERQQCVNTLPTATTTSGHMTILSEFPGEGYKLCRKKLHWYQGNKCKTCRNIRANIDYHKKTAQGIAWYQQNKNTHNATGRKQYWQNSEQRKNKWKQWRADNLEHDLKRNQNYAQKNKDVVRRKAARRRANKKTQTPAWADLQQINYVYRSCPDGHHVDHIYPLKSDYMCGLHVETNLQILSEFENMVKSNRTWPGQLDCQKLPVSVIFPKELTNLLNDN